MSQRKSLHLDYSKLNKAGDRFSLGRLLSKGPTSQVYQGLDRNNGDAPVVIKVLENLEEDFPDIEEEYKILKNLSRHPNLAEFVGAFMHTSKENKEQLWLVSQHCLGGSVADLLSRLKKQERKLSEDVIGYILKEVIAALTHLHMNHVIHRDVKCANIVLTLEGEVKLIDFGYSRNLKKTMNKRLTSIGSPHWMAPEVISCYKANKDRHGEHEEDGYDNHCDVWSLGITAIELADCEPPLWNLHPVRVLFQTVHNPPPDFKKPTEWSNTFRDFVNECLVKIPEHRPVAMELGQHPFIEEVPEDIQMLRTKLKDHIGKNPTVDNERRNDFIRNGFLKTDILKKSLRMLPDNLAAMDQINDENVVNILGLRFKKGDFQTYAGDVLLIINPNKDSDMYSDKYHEHYAFKSRSDENPHVYGVSDRAWQDMMHHKEHQNIIISGDRLSGKSFNFLETIRHLCFLSRGNQMVMNRVENLPFLLDTIGNAATEGSSNSSRHTRYIELTFTDTGKLSGAIISIYMLEKWRISHFLSKTNRNFHIFYYMYYGLKKDGLLRQYMLDGFNQFRYLPTGETKTEMDYYLMGYDKMKKVFDLWDLEKNEYEFPRRIVSAILLLGEVQFCNGNAASIENTDVIKKVADLLSVGEGLLTMALTKCNLPSDGKPNVRNYTVVEAEEARDAFARSLYSRFVDWVVYTLNQKLTFTRLLFGDKLTLGVLDPPGFEYATRKNSFEQLISNITSEQILYQFNQSVFAWEMEDYKKEELSLKPFDFNDNHSILNGMLSKPDGLFSFLDNITKSTSSDQNISSVIMKQFRSSEVVEVKDGSTFVIKHSGGDVTYQTDLFVEKNRDFVPVDLNLVLRKSSNPIIVELFATPVTKTGHIIIEKSVTMGNDQKSKKDAKNDNKKKQSTKGFPAGHYSQTREMLTVLGQARHSMMEILQKLVRGSQHYIRCMRRNNKPNEEGIDKDCLLQQIQEFGLVHTIRIRKNGYSHRIPFEDFLKGYQFLAFDFDENVDMTMDNCRLLLLRLKMEGWLIGKTKVFLKYYNEEYLSRMYEDQVRKIVKIQAMLRALLAKKRRQKGKGPQAHSPHLANQQKPVGLHGSNQPALGARKDRPGHTRDQAASVIQRYFKRWKMKSMFQQLMLYRGDKYQQLIYFCQQVHIYNQEHYGYIIHSEEVNTSRITKEERKPFKLNMLNKKRIPLQLGSDHYFDTSIMRKDEKVPYGPSSRSDPYAKGSNFLASRNAYQRSHSPSVQPSARHSPNVPIVTVQEWNGRQSSNNAPKYVPGKTQGYNVQSSRPYSPSHQVGKGGVKEHPINSNQQQIAREIQQRASEINASADDSESAPFNFQAMLRKTNINRDSIRRSKSVDVDGSSYNFQGVRSQSAAFNSNREHYLQSNRQPGAVNYQQQDRPAVFKSPKTRVNNVTTHQIAPNLILEGVASEL